MPLLFRRRNKLRRTPSGNLVYESSPERRRFRRLHKRQQENIWHFGVPAQQIEAFEPIRDPWVPRVGNGVPVEGRLDWDLVRREQEREVAQQDEEKKGRGEEESGESVGARSGAEPGQVREGTASGERVERVVGREFLSEREERFKVKIEKKFDIGWKSRPAYQSCCYGSERVPKPRAPGEPSFGSKVKKSFKEWGLWKKKDNGNETEQGLKDELDDNAAICRPCANRLCRHCKTVLERAGVAVPETQEGSTETQANVEDQESSSVGAVDGSAEATPTPSPARNVRFDPIARVNSRSVPLLETRTTKEESDSDSETCTQKETDIQTGTNTQDDISPAFGNTLIDLEQESSHATQGLPLPPSGRDRSRHRGGSRLESSAFAEAVKSEGANSREDPFQTPPRTPRNSDDHEATEPLIQY